MTTPPHPTRRSRLGLPLLLALFLSSPLLAQATAESAEEGEEYRNAVELFLGGATEAEGGATGFAIGLGYLRDVTEYFKAGIAAEYVAGLNREFVILAPLYVRPAWDLHLAMGPGIDRRLETNEDGEEEATVFLVVRFGVAWEFEINPHFTISPEVNADVVDGSATWVYGAAFGVKF